MATETGENKYKKYGQPTLDLVFTGEKKSLTDRVGNKTVEFTRSSTATYVEGGVVKYASQDQARFEKEGLLIEESRTNLIPNSTDLTGWSTITLGDGVTPTSANVTDTAPDNSTSVTKVTLSRTTATTSNYSIYRVSVTHASAVATGSIYVKAFSASDVGKVVDVYNNQGSPQDFQTVTLTDEWQRMTSVGASPSTQSFLSVGLFNSSASTGTVNVLIWGAQVEVGSFPTSYIPTAGQAGGVIRSVDIAQITGNNFSSWYNQSEGTVFAKSSYFGLSTSSTNRIYDINDGGTQDRHQLILRQANDDLRVQTRANNVNGFSESFNMPVKNQVFSNALGYKINDCASSLDGGDTVNDYTVQIPTVDRMFIGSKDSSTSFLNGHISRLSYYTRRLTDSELQTITS